MRNAPVDVCHERVEERICLGWKSAQIADRNVELATGATKAELEQAIAGHVLTTAELVGTLRALSADE